jgi:hypothetical protein
MNNRLGRRVVALIAAYALALNALLAPAAITALAAATPWADICSADRSQPPGGDKPPAQHGVLCPLAGACSAPGCGGLAGANDDRDGALSHAALSDRLVFLARRNDRAAVPRDFDRQFARAPPAA